MGDDRLAPPDAITVDSDGDEHEEAWEDSVDGIDRVASVAMSLEQPRTASYIGTKAQVSETTARKHLERLVEFRILAAVEQRGAKTYFPDQAYQHFREVSQMVEEHDQSEIEQITVSAKEEIEHLKETYDVDSPADLRSAATEEETSSAEAREYFKKASEWDQHLRMLSIANEALDRYSDISKQGPEPSHATV